MGETEWAAAPGYEAVDGRRTAPAFLVGVLAGMVALAVVWAMTVVLSGTGGDTRTDSGRAAAPTAAAPTASATPSTGAAEPSQQAGAAPSQADRCRRADAELARPLRAARPALDQWEVHVGAMNKLVVGAITPAQAGAFWSRSKVGAIRNLARFHAATRRVPLAGVDCPDPGAVTQASPGLRPCARHVARERDALEAAEIALRTWKRHIRDMRMLDMGHLSPDRANRLWLANWQRGVRELQTFRDADRAVERGRGC